MVLAALAISRAPMAAQSVEGAVVAAGTDAPLAFTTVTLTPGFPERFTNDSGRFAFRSVAPGTYRLRARQIGYLPFDTVVVVGANPLVLRIVLRSLAVELPPVTILGQATCRDPGPPDPATQPDLALIFEQLRENGARYRLLADEYAFRYWMERVSWGENQEAAVVSQVFDTLERRSDARRPYRPGGLVQTAMGPRGRERVLRVPTLADLADSVFHSAHCFYFGGVELLGGRPHLRVDFLAAERLRRPDVDGTAWLDPDTYSLRRLTLQLTNPGRADRAMVSLEATALYDDLLPSVPVPVRITAVTTVRPRRRSDPGRLHEDQQVLRIEFVRPPPGRS